MKWDDPSVAGFARQAGWQGGDVALATAVALATSAGDDAYEYAAPFHLPGLFVGLWGVDVETFPEFDASLMRNPVYNAEAAHSIWLRLGRSWGWNAAYNSGFYRRFAAEAALATTQTSPAQYGFALGGDDLDSSGLAGLASSGHTSVNGLATVVRGL